MGTAADKHARVSFCNDITFQNMSLESVTDDVGKSSIAGLTSENEKLRLRIRELEEKQSKRPVYRITIPINTGETAAENSEVTVKDGGRNRYKLFFNYNSHVHAYGNNSVFFISNLSRNSCWRRTKSETEYGGCGARRNVRGNQCQEAEIVSYSFSWCS